MNKCLVISFLGLALMTSGCASIGKQWKALISGEPTVEQQAKIQKPMNTFSQNNNMAPPSDRKYKRTTRKDIEDGANLSARAGSLWVMEGQGAYLFAENTVRMIGDPVSVKIEGEPKEQLIAKSDVINGLLKQLEDRRKRAASRATQDEKGKKDDAEKPAVDPLAKANSAGQNPAEGASREPASDGSFTVKAVPTRVVERMVDGNYRVRGAQPFMIGGREYKVIVSGIVRAEDFNEQGVSSSQLLDPSFDIVSAKGAEMREATR